MSDRTQTDPQQQSIALPPPPPAFINVVATIVQRIRQKDRAA